MIGGAPHRLDINGKIYVNQALIMRLFSFYYVYASRHCNNFVGTCSTNPIVHQYLPDKAKGHRKYKFYPAKEIFRHILAKTSAVGKKSFLRPFIKSRDDQNIDKIMLEYFLSAPDELSTQKEYNADQNDQLSLFL